MSINGKDRRFCVITMINGTDVMGDLVGDISEEHPWMELEHPCSLVMRPPNELVLNNMLRNSPALSGTSIMVNMRCVSWIIEPSGSLLSAYQAQRAGLVVLSSKPVVMNG